MHAAVLDCNLYTSKVRPLLSTLMPHWFTTDKSALEEVYVFVSHTCGPSCWGFFFFCPTSTVTDDGGFVGESSASGRVCLF